ncbi:MAG: AAA family ATPase [Spirochaetaceae bacterium]|nr:AAA family ATPase [Spirochaetaceae bacterium]
MNNALKDRFFEYLTDKQLSQNKVAREIGYSAAVLSQYRKGSYGGDVGRLEREIEKWLEKQSRKGQIKKVQFVETGVFRKIYSALTTAHEERTMGFIVGPAGIGKTMAISKYAEENPNVYLIQGESGLKENDVVRKLAGLLNIKGNSIVGMKEGIMEQLADKAAIVVVDEANYLHPAILDMLRRVVFDQAACPVVFVGVRELMGNIFQNPRDFKQLQRRIGVFLDLNRYSLDKKDVKAMVETVFKDVPDQQVKVLRDVTGGNPGVLSLLVERAYRVVMLNEIELDEEVIESCRQSVFLTARLA